MSDFPYPGKYTFVDVEIPNLNNDCICAISVIVIEDHKEVVRHTELINPKTYFSANNIEIHHILRKDVLHARTLDQFWEDYGKYFRAPYIIGAHNTQSDMSVLNKDLSRFGEKITSIEYVDTMDIMSKYYYKGNQKKGDLRLNNIAEHLGIEIDHHNPESDVNACCEIIKYMGKYFDMNLDPFIKPIPEAKYKPSKPPHVPSRRQMKIFLAYTRKQIANRAEEVQMNARKAKALGDQAFRNQDYEGIIFHYEIAIARRWSTPAVYLKLAQTYDKLNMHYDAIRVLDQGIRILKSSGQNWHVLKGVEQRISSMQAGRLEKQKAQSSRQLVDQATKQARERKEYQENARKRSLGPDAIGNHHSDPGSSKASYADQTVSASPKEKTAPDKSGSKNVRSFFGRNKKQPEKKKDVRKKPAEKMAPHPEEKTPVH